MAGMLVQNDTIDQALCIPLSKTYDWSIPKIKSYACMITVHLLLQCIQ